MPKPSLQSQFFASMAEPQDFRVMFEHLPGVFFFVKDDQGRMIGASTSFLERLGIRCESAIVGATDDDFFPPEIARAS